MFLSEIVIILNHYEHFTTMKHFKFTFLLTALMSMVGIEVVANNIAVMNDDGVFIYYNYVNNKTELAVTYRGSSYDSYSNEYTGVVNIPSSVTYDGKTYSVTSIGSYAFYNCSGLTSITIPNSVTRIDDDAFSGCSGLNSVTIPNSVTTIGSSAFRGCSGLTSVTIPNSVTTIGYCAFRECSDLPSVTIPNGVTNIGEYAFYGCSGLTSITIPDGVPGVNYGTFQNCSGLTNVIIGCNVKYLGGEAFDWCNSVKELICLPTTPPDCYNGSNLAGINKSECILKVPIGSKQAYQDAEYWNEFQLIVEADVTAIGSIRADEPADGKIESIYDINGSRRSSLQRGINIIRMSDGTTKKVMVK